MHDIPHKYIKFYLRLINDLIKWKLNVFPKFTYFHMPFWIFFYIY